MQTDLGGVDLELFDVAAPLTVQNFINYMNRGSAGGYDGTFIHRSVPGFVVQGGGYVFNPDDGGFFDSGTSHIPTDPPIINEADPVNRPNVRGTIAMAMTADPDSATSEWFINLVDNPALDDPNNSGGFTVFGRVLGDGMGAIDAVAAQPRCLNFAPFPALCAPFPETPFIGYDGSEAIQPKHLDIVNIIGADNDGDGAVDSLEDAAPNGGDGNNDGILDSIQGYVASFPGSAGNYVVIESPLPTPLRSLDVLGETFFLANPPVFPGLFEASNGYAGFDIDGLASGAAVNITMTLAASEAPETYYLYGPTPDDSNPHWYEFLFDGQTGAEINGNVITLHFSDGMRGDADMNSANGMVTASPGGPAVRMDADDDGVPDAVEGVGPNAGDANNDGIKDQLQAHIASFPDINGDYVLLETSAIQAFDSVIVTSTLPPDAEVLGANFFSGFFSFGVTAPDDSGAVDVTLTLPTGATLDNYYMFGATPDNSSSHWFAFLHDGQTGAVINDNTVTLQFIDGMRGDADQDGTNRRISIVPGGPAIDTDMNDIDNDGVTDLLEDNGPNTGDGNADGTADSIQPHVVSLFQQSTGTYVVLEADSVYEFKAVKEESFLFIENPSSIINGLNFSHGLFGFRLTGVADGGTASVRVILPEGINPSNYYQFGKTPDNPEEHWYSFLSDGLTGATFAANVVTLRFVDGERGDSDLTKDGVIIDPGGPASRIGISGSNGSGGGCSLNGNATQAQTGAWWLVLALFSLHGWWCAYRRACR